MVGADTAGRREPKHVHVECGHELWTNSDRQQIKSPMNACACMLYYCNMVRWAWWDWELSG